MSDIKASRLVPLYLLMIAVAVGAYLGIRALGSGMEAASPVPGAHAVTAHGSMLATIMLALATIMVVAHLLGAACHRWLGQPPVIGEIVAGILLGPSCLGALSPELYGALLPSAAAPFLGLISQLGVVLFMFVVGLELDPKLLRGQTHVNLAISHASIVVPFLAGALLAVWLYPRYGTPGVSFTAFSLFVGVSLSVTAFPVLARILNDRQMQGTTLGALALACAAVDDATAWGLLAIVVGVTTTDLEAPVRTLALVLGYLAVMILAVRPWYLRLLANVERRGDALSRATLAWMLAGLLLSATATELIGIHPLFGAFLFGALLPHDGEVAVALRHRLEDLVIVLFLPAFFAFTGMRTEIALVQGWQDWLFCGLIILVATLGKFGGTIVAARLCHVGWRDSAALGILMNTRGLMELVVLNVGLELGVIGPRLFTMMVLMALVTTFATSPVLELILSAGRRRARVGAARLI